jgi:putative transposase
MCTNAATPLKLSDAERQQEGDLLVSLPLVDHALATMATNPIDDGIYLCSVRTMYWILHEHDQVRKRRRGHPCARYEKPGLVAREPNQCWPWTITKLKGPATWQCFYLYVILGLYSCYLAGWMMADRAPAVLANQLITQTLVSTRSNKAS